MSDTPKYLAVLRPWRRIRDLERQLAYALRSVEKYRRLRMHVGKDGTPKKALTEAEARGLETRKRNPSQQYQAFECWCGAWHIGHLRTPKEKTR